MPSSSTRTLALSAVASMLVGATIAFGCSTFSETTPSPEPPGDAGVPEAAASFCQRTEAGFCDDFEDLPLGAKWPAGSQLEGGTLTLVDGSVASPLYALRSFVPGTTLPDASGTSGQAQLLRYQPRSVVLPVIIVDADLRIDSVSQAKNGVVAILNMSFEGTKSIFFVVGQNGGLVAANAFALGGPPDAGANPAGVTLPPLHTWMHVRLEADLVAGTLTLSIDGDVRFKDAPGVVSNAPEYLLGVGVLASEPRGSTEVSFDNVVLTAR